MITKFEGFVNESIDLEHSYDYKYTKTIEKTDKDGDNSTIFEYVFSDEKNRNYYVNLITWKQDYSYFGADFREEESYILDIKNKVDNKDITYLNLNRFDALRVLTTVFKVVKDFYEYNIKTLKTFSITAEIKRRNIYKMIIEKIFPKWELTSDEKVNNIWQLTYKL